MQREWSTLAKVVFKRTYARKLFPGADGPLGERLETYQDTVERAISGNVRGHNVSEAEIQRLRYFMLERKAGPAGRGLWFSGTDAHYKIGGVALNNCWFVTSSDWLAFVIACDLLMLGGGVGISVEHKYTSKLPKIKKGVVITHKPTKDADFIVPDSREGWCELLRRVLEAFFVTGKGFTYSTVCVRGYGEPIAGFGGTASGPLPLIELINNLIGILVAREGRHVRPLDAADILCAIGSMVVAGNVRRSAIIIIGDAYDKEYLRAKRWDLITLPAYRSSANWSVNVEDIEDVHPLFWKTYEQGEPFGIVNMANIRRYGRMGELRKDTAEGVNPCGEATLEPYEPCNLQDIDLPNLDGEEEFFEACRLMQRWGKRVTLERYHIPQVAEVIARNRRIGTSITGCLQSPLFNPETLDRAYAHIRQADREYSQELGVNESIRNTTLKPSGTKSKMDDVDGEGIHGGWSRYMIQRIRFASIDKIVPALRDAGHHIEPVIKLDGNLDHGTQVIDFYRKAPDNLPCVDEGFDLWKQLNSLLVAQRHWSDQAVSITVTYEKPQIPQIKQWLGEHLKELKSISFLCHSDHGFKQAPKEAITREQYERAIAKLKPVDIDAIGGGADLDGMECAGGVCPIK
jgi:ribonucleoside-triphosphate reductase